MTKQEWGVKRVCPTTGKRFYDLNRAPVVSPYTGEVVEIDDPARRAGFAVSGYSAERAKPRAKSQTTEDDELLVEDDAPEVDLDEDLLEDEDDNNVSLDDLTDVASDADDD